VRIIAEDVLAAGGGNLPPTPGVWDVDGGGLTFAPRFPFVAGRRYAVVIDGDVVDVLERPAESRRSSVRVAAVFPSGDTVPRNLLRLYLCFTGRMSDGRASGIRLVGAPHAFLPTDEEFWDPTRTRLTLFLDPARIKRGLVSHAAMGYPLRQGERVCLVVDGMRDATGAQVDPYTIDLGVGPDLRHRLDAARWRLAVPRAGGRDALTVTFDRQLDHGLLQRTITPPVPGRADIGSAEQSWSFEPDEPWRAGEHAIVVDTVLEDVAGNSLRRAFDRDLADAKDNPLDADKIRLPFWVD
jgi:hypothetical protein